MKNLPLRTKLFASFGAVLLLGLAIAGYSAWNTRSLATSLEHAVTVTAAKLDLINALRQRVQEMAASQRGAWIAWSIGNQEEGKALEAKFLKAQARTKEQIAEIRPLLVTEEGKAAMAVVEKQLAEWERLAPQAFAAMGGSNGAAALPLLQRINPLIAEFETAAAEVVAIQRAFLKEDRAAASQRRQTSTAVTLALIALLVAVGVGSGFTVQRAAGDLRRIVDELRNGAMGLASSSEEFTSTSRSLANSATQQASAITETTASTSQVRSMAEANRESAEGAAEDMERASRLIGGTVESMGHLTTWIGEVRDSSRKISKIIKAIDEIAMQTNILALNAAVEAARAGEAGAGFGVVADEVRNLAQRCAQAARETTTLIEESILQADKGQRRLEDMAQAVNELTPVADSTRDRVKNVSQASQEQSHSIREVGEALSHLESLTAQVAAGAEESSVTSQELSKQANSLSTVANRLHVIAG